MQRNPIVYSGGGGLLILAFTLLMFKYLIAGVFVFIVSFVCIIWYIQYTVAFFADFFVPIKLILYKKDEAILCKLYKFVLTVNLLNILLDRLYRYI